MTILARKCMPIGLPRLAQKSESVSVPHHPSRGKMIVIDSSDLVSVVSNSSCERSIAKNWKAIYLQPTKMTA